MVAIQSMTTTGINIRLNSKADLNSPKFTGTVEGVTQAMIGLGSVDDTNDMDKPVSVAQAAADTQAKDRANHTGTQVASTISDFDAAVALVAGSGGSGVTVEMVTAAKDRANHTGTQVASTISDFDAAVALVAGSGGSSEPVVYGTVYYGDSYGEDVVSSAMHVWTIGNTAYLEGVFSNTEVISVVGNTQYEIGGLAEDFRPNTDQLRPALVGQDGIGLGVGALRINNSTGAITWESSVAWSSIPVGALHVAVSLISWPVSSHVNS